MTPRERVLTSLNHREPDRVPLFAPNRIRTAEPYDDALLAFLEAFPFDDHVQLDGMAYPPPETRDTETVTTDEFGCRFEYKGHGIPYCTHSPLAAAETVAAIEAYAWPSPEHPLPMAPEAPARVRALHAQQERVLGIGVGSVFHRYHYMRGFEQWMIDVKLHRDIHEAIANRIHQINLERLMRLLDAFGGETDIVFGGDDLGTSRAPYMSPEDFRALVKPFYRDLVARIKKRFPRIRFYLHSHGQIMDLVGDLVECGVDILNPVLPLDHMDPARLKRDFGDRLCFHGGIDIEHILPFGSLDEVRDHVRRTIDVLAPGGGYWFKLQAISPVIPARNVIAAYELALEYGAYA